MMCMRLRGAGEQGAEGEASSPFSAPVNAPVPYIQHSLAPHSESTLTSQRGQLVGARSKAAAAAQVAQTAVGGSSPSNAVAVRPKEIFRDAEDTVLPLGNWTAGDRAATFAQTAIEGDGGLEEMQRALVLAQQGNLTFEEVEKILIDLTDQAAEGKSALLGRRAFHCCIQAAELIASAGDDMCLFKANRIILEMEEIGCWPDASTYDAILGVFIKAAEIGVARTFEAEETLRHMTTTIHIDYPSSGGYQHATAMLGSISFPEMTGPVGVARVAIPVRESHITALMNIASHMIQHRLGGLADIDRIVQ